MGDIVELVKEKKDRSIDSILREANLAGRANAEKANPQMIVVRGYESDPLGELRLSHSLKQSGVKLWVT